MALEKMSTEERQEFEFWEVFVRSTVRYAQGIATANDRDLEEAQRFVPGIVDSPAVRANPNLEATALVQASRLLLDGPSPDHSAPQHSRRRLRQHRERRSHFFRAACLNGCGPATRMAHGRWRTRLGRRPQGSDLISADFAEMLFVAAIGGLLTDPGRFEQSARQFIQTKHSYAPLVSMLLRARSQGLARDDAVRIVDEFWSRVRPETWDRRLRLGDRQASYANAGWLLRGPGAGRRHLRSATK